jgi:hypothetical protein
MCGAFQRELYLIRCSLSLAGDALWRWASGEGQGHGRESFLRAGASMRRIVLGLFLSVCASSVPATAEAAVPVLAAAGDIACAPGTGTTASRCKHAATARLLSGATVVAPLGDLQYPSGTLRTFLASYAPTWGVYAAITRPVPGNHEYLTSGAAGYFDYFRRRAGTRGNGYYSYDLGAWHVVALNSNCRAVGGCGARSAQKQWLRSDLAATNKRCILAYWHHPRFSSGKHGASRLTQGFWRVLYRYRADVVLNGHDHHYERFARQTPDGDASSDGIRQFVVGTGGASLRRIENVQPNSQVRNANTFGVLKLRLMSSRYSWRFAPIAGSSFSDSGTTTCH